MHDTNIRIGNILSHGGYSTAYHGTLNEKEIVYKVVNKDNKTSFINEVKILGKLNHKYVIKPIKVNYEDMSLITEYKGHNLFSFINPRICDFKFSQSVFKMNIYTSNIKYKIISILI